MPIRIADPPKRSHSLSAPSNSVRSRTISLKRDPYYAQLLCRSSQSEFQTPNKILHPTLKGPQYRTATSTVMINSQRGLTLYGASISNLQTSGKPNHLTHNKSATWTGGQQQQSSNSYKIDSDNKFISIPQKHFLTLTKSSQNQTHTSPFNQFFAASKKAIDNEKCVVSYNQKLRNKGIVNRQDSLKLQTSLVMSIPQIHLSHCDIAPLPGFYLIRCLGYGKSSTVVLVQHAPTRLIIAIKHYLHRQKSSKTFDSQRNITALKARLYIGYHQNIVPLYGVINSCGKLNILMEYSTGGSLFEKLIEIGPLKEQQCWNLAHQMLRGLLYLHEQNVSHNSLGLTSLLLFNDSVWKIGSLEKCGRLQGTSGQRDCWHAGFIVYQIFYGIWTHSRPFQEKYLTHFEGVRDQILSELDRTQGASSKTLVYELQSTQGHIKSDSERDISYQNNASIVDRLNQNSIFNHIEMQRVDSSVQEDIDASQGHTKRIIVNSNYSSIAPIIVSNESHQSEQIDQKLSVSYAYASTDYDQLIKRLLLAEDNHQHCLYQAISLTERKNISN